LKGLEEHLIEEMKQGSHRAFERCYRMFSPQIYSVIFRICRNEASAQELLQDTFLDIFENLDRYSTQYSFINWAKRIAFNNTLNFIKRHNRISLDESFTNDNSETISCSFKQIDDGELIESLFEKTTEPERLVLWLFIVEEYKHEEIGELFAKSSSYSKSIVSRALKKIRVSREVKDHAC